ncbi:unnamed protein product [Symbiodinium sp. CCMP2592]|nr:unnamed protein product [Symbiodinium sp. CCMP2592]
MVRRGPPKRAAKKPPKKLPDASGAEAEVEGAEEEALESPGAGVDEEAEALPGSPAEEQEVPHEAESAEVTVQPALPVHLEVPSDGAATTGVTDDEAIRAAQRQRKQSSYLARRQFVAEEPLSFRRSGYAAQQPNRTTVSYAAQRGREQLASSTGDPASPSAGRVASPGLRWRRLKSAFRAQRALREEGHTATAPQAANPANALSADEQ